MRDTPPAEMNGRTFRDFGCRDFDWLRLAKKTDGTVGSGSFNRVCVSRTGFLEGRFRKRRHYNRTFGDVTLDRNRPQNSLFP